MKRILTALLLSVSEAAMVAPAFAQFGFGGIVYDPTNHAQNLLTAARSLTQVQNQIKQLAHEVTMLENQAKNLTNLPTSVADDLKAKLATIDALIKVAEGIAYTVAEIETDYETIYRESYGASPPPAPVIVAEARGAWLQSRSGYKHALQVQAQVVTNLQDDIDDLHGLVGDSQGADGNLQALQAGNQIAALSAEQMMQIQTLLAAQYRAEALEASRALAERERGRARLNRFLGDASAYTPGGSL
jgi:P-type conjugative transfer protein TrbJ